MSGVHNRSSSPDLLARIKWVSLGIIRITWPKQNSWFSPKTCFLLDFSISRSSSMVSCTRNLNDPWWLSVPHLPVLIGHDILLTLSKSRNLPKCQLPLLKKKKRDNNISHPRLFKNLDNTFYSLTIYPTRSTNSHCWVWSDTFGTHRLNIHGLTLHPRYHTKDTAMKKKTGDLRSPEACSPWGRKAEGETDKRNKTNVSGGQVLSKQGLKIR